MSAVLFPYSTLLGDVVLNLESAEIDGRPVPRQDINPIQRRIAIHALEKARWDELVLKVAVALPNREIEAYDVAGKTVVVVVRSQCKATSARQSVVLIRTAPSIWEGNVALAFDAYEKQAKLDAVVTVDDPDRHIIGYSPTWSIDLEMPNTKKPPSSSRLIDCRYVRFSEASEPYLRAAASEIAYTDLETDPPTLWLNEDIPGLRALMGESEGRRGAAVPYRDIIANELSEKMWFAMFNAAIVGLEPGVDGSEYPPMPGGWQGRVLQPIVAELYPGYSRDQALLELRNAVRADSDLEIRSLQSRLVHVIDRLVGSSRSIQQLLTKQASRFDGDDAL